MATAKLKYFLNYLADEDLVIDVARRMLDGMGISERAFIEKFYMDRPMVRHLGSTGSLGSHAFSHRPLAGMTPGAIRSELLESKRLLKEISGVSVDSISYPFGSPHAVDRQVADSRSRPDTDLASRPSGRSTDRSRTRCFWPVLTPLISIGGATSIRASVICRKPSPCAFIVRADGA